MTILLKIIKIIVINYDVNFKLEIVVGDYSFNFFKTFKIVITHYGFNDMTKEH